MGKRNGRAKVAGASQPKAKPEIQPATRIKGVKRGKPGLKSIPASKVTMQRLAAEPNATVRLSPSQIKQRKEADERAQKDPEAYLRAVREAG